MSLLNLSSSTDTESCQKGGDKHLYKQNNPAYCKHDYAYDVISSQQGTFKLSRNQQNWVYWICLYPRGSFISNRGAESQTLCLGVGKFSHPLKTVFKR
jgi:hypothetical protein